MGCGASSSNTTAEPADTEGRGTTNSPPLKSPAPEQGTSPFATVAPPASVRFSDKDDEDTLTASDAAPQSRRNRSKSVAVLQLMSARRSVTFSDAFEPAPEERVAGSSPDRVVAQRRHRRLSSIFGEFSDQMLEFMEAKSIEAPCSTATPGGITQSPPSPPAPRETGEEALRRMFDTLDIEGSGRVTRDTLAEGFRRMGLQGNWLTLFDVADKDKLGSLDWTAFSRFFRVLGSGAGDSGDAEDADDHQPEVAFRRTRRTTRIVVRYLRNFSIRSVYSFPKRVKVLAASQHERLFAGADRDDKAVRIVTFDGLEVRRLQGHRDSMLGIAFSPDRKLVVSASRDSFLTLWDAHVGHAQHSVQHPGVVTACVFSFDGSFLYSGCQDNFVRKFEQKKCRLLRTSEKLPNSETGVIVALAAQKHADDYVIMSRSCDQWAYCLTASNLAVWRKLGGHSGLVWNAGFNSTGAVAFTYCDRIVNLWDATQEFACLSSISSSAVQSPARVLGRKGRVWTAASFCPNDFPDIVALACNDASTYIYVMSTSSCIAYVQTRTSVYTIASSSELNSVFLGDDQGNVYELSLM